MKKAVLFRKFIPAYTEVLPRFLFPFFLNAFLAFLPSPTLFLFSFSTFFLFLSLSLSLSLSLTFRLMFYLTGPTHEHAAYVCVEPLSRPSSYKIRRHGRDRGRLCARDAADQVNLSLLLHIVLCSIARPL